MRTERTTGWRPDGVVAAVLTILLGLPVAGCAPTVAGTPWPVGQGPARPADASAPAAPGTPPSSFTVPGPATSVAEHPTTTVAPGPASPEPPGPPAPPTAGGTTRTVPPAPVEVRAAPVPDGGHGAEPAPPAPPPTRAPAPLTADVVADECLLDADTLAGLLDATPAVAAANAGTERPDGSRSRACFAVGGSSTVSVNVYTTNRVTPDRYVRDAAGARAVTGTGEGTTAALLDTVAGPTLQLGTARHLVTIAVAGRAPSDEQWRTAARTAVAALARR
ncbi:hypothetical protein [Pseudonocardia parietis]|uniref:DUF3558 domain-containing protein n=1 Tax=Pseudonocardia parietis TaxID=570936 RepID=A0ABS4VU78_9PSEU|nr:hypothetical protein [Pseudonocardia parietis]MBP2367346.1 hypothetical protein [Pseudonocardia parietis]